MKKYLTIIIAILFLVVFEYFAISGKIKREKDIEDKGYVRGYLQCSDAQAKTYHFYFDGKDIHGKVPNSDLIKDYCGIGMGTVFERSEGYFETDCGEHNPYYDCPSGICNLNDKSNNGEGV